MFQVSEQAQLKLSVMRRARVLRPALRPLEQRSVPPQVLALPQVSVHPQSTLSGLHQALVLQQQRLPRVVTQ